MGRFVQFFFRNPALLICALPAFLLFLGGCERLGVVRHDPQKLLQFGAERLAARDFRGAVSAYENALDGTPKTAEAHFRLALIYYDNLQDPVGAIHHFRRYLEVADDGPFAKQARANIARAEMNLSAGLSNGTLVSRGEATRIRGENLQLKQQLAIAKASPPPGPKGAAKGAPVSADDAATGGKANQRAAAVAVKEAERKAQAETRTYKVQPGDTLQGISRKFYQTPNRASDILDANLNALPDESNLRAGMTLIIP